MTTTASPTEDLLQVVVFTVGEEEYALPVHRVESIVTAIDITRVPGAGPHIKGVHNLRGRVISIIDLRSRLGNPPRPAGTASRILVVGDGETTVGLEVDSVTEVFSVEGGAVSPPPERLAGDALVEGILRIGSRLIIVVDLDSLL